MLQQGFIKKKKKKKKKKKTNKQTNKNSLSVHPSQLRVSRIGGTPIKLLIYQRASSCTVDLMNKMGEILLLHSPVLYHDIVAALL